MTKKHPEQRSGEIYLGNAYRHDAVWKSSWQTGRLGDNPLKADGTPLIDNYLKPWFIKRSEVEAAIRTERLANEPRSAEKIRVYESMLTEDSEEEREV